MAASLPAALSAGATPAPLDYAALAKLPDWSGWWATDYTNALLPWKRPVAPFKPGQMAKVQVILKMLQAGQDVNAVTKTSQNYCRPRVFPGVYIIGIEPLAEFLFTPGRVTLSSELGDIRRIFTDGRPLPQDPDTSNMGSSVGHWEGDALVVHTVGLNPHGLIGAPGFPNIEIGAGASSVERIHLKDPEHLDIDTELTAPAVLTAVFKTTAHFKREPGHEFHEYSLCADNDRAIDPATGKQRFDITPPAGLPPPPKP